MPVTQPRFAPPRAGGRPSPSYRAGSGEPLLLLHPFTASWHAWAPVIGLLRTDHDVLAPTMLGHWGGPSITSAGLSVQTIVDQVEVAMTAAGWDTAHVAGNSLGGWVGLELARRGRARSVTAIAPAGGWVEFDSEHVRLERFFRTADRGRPVLTALGASGVPAAVRAPALAVFCRHPLRVPDAIARMLLRAPARCAAYRPFIDSVAEHGVAGDLHEITAPVLIVECRHDLILRPAALRRFRDECPDVAHVVLPGVGHVPMPEAPQAVADIVRRHIAGHSSARNDRRSS